MWGLDQGFAFRGAIERPVQQQGRTIGPADLGYRYRHPLWPVPRLFHCGLETPHGLTACPRSTHSIHPPIQVLDGQNDEQLRRDALDTVCAVAVCLGPDFAIFVPTIRKVGAGAGAGAWECDDHGPHAGAAPLVGSVRGEGWCGDGATERMQATYKGRNMLPRPSPGSAKEGDGVVGLWQQARAVGWEVGRARGTGGRGHRTRRSQVRQVGVDAPTSELRTP